uniref:Serine peptidase inhibitor Kazal type 13 n=1 Tax=Prolemur simus TaxID=1328070 RepID=A0A8C9AU20_PROSS
MAAFPRKTVLFLVYSTLAHLVFSEIFKPRRPEPPCEMYNPPHPSYEVSCPNITAYICATNGFTYQNECFYCLDKWEFDLDIKVKKEGKCS